MKVIIKDNRVYVGERFSVSFQRTLRVPDNDQHYPLPPGLGVFPILRIEDHRDCVPKKWRERGGFFIPMYQREAVWLGFGGADWKPNAVKIGVGRVNAISGGKWDMRLHTDPQDYLVCPDQLWLDGVNAGDGFIRQFVAMPLGEGYTVEAQVTGAEDFGGIQLIVYEPQPGRFPDKPPPIEMTTVPAAMFASAAAPMVEMGLAPGGKMRQKIYPDSYGIDTWDEEKFEHISVRILNSKQFRQVTGLAPPVTPVTAKTYTKYGLPWFDLYDEAYGDVAGAEKLARVKSVGEISSERNAASRGDETLDLPESQVKKLRHAASKPARRRR